jgi:glycosyltransferase involved in cell wall biosynthesis
VPAVTVQNNFQQAPLVSVITPAFNAAGTLLRAYRSIVAQSCTDWEYILVDDGSSDNTAEIIAESQDPRVRSVVRIANGGSGAALNAGVRHASGSYLAFLDADDEFLPTHLEAHIAVMEREPNIDLLWGGVDLVVKEEEQAWIPDLVRGYGFIHASQCTVQGTLFVRSHVLNTVQFSEDRDIWYQDFDFVRRVESASFECRQFHLPTYRYHRDSGQSVIDRVKTRWGVENPRA